MKTIKLLIIILIGIPAFAQVYSNKVVGKKNEAVRDSLKHQEYEYVLPIWGQKATQKGFKLPYSAGFSVNSFWQKSDLIINNLQVGFNNGPMYNLDQLIRFDKAVSEAFSVNVRPDVWLFPFLNVYGIFGKANTSTTINAGLYVPDGGNNGNSWSKIMDFSSKANFNATMAGMGITPTIGVGGGWFALDMNMVWSDVDALDKPVFTYVFGPRFGKTFQLKKPESNIAFWTGGFRVHLSSQTKGSLALSEVLPPGQLQQKVDNALVQVDQKQASVNSWWNSLSQADQAKPGNIKKYETANNALNTAENFLNAVDGALSTVNNSTVQYSLDKKPKDMWNFLVGAQYQFNRHYMFRAECGFLGSRTQVLGGLQYRFGL